MCEVRELTKYYTDVWMPLGISSMHPGLTWTHAAQDVGILWL